MFIKFHHPENLVCIQVGKTGQGILSMYVTQSIAQGHANLAFLQMLQQGREINIITVEGIGKLRHDGSTFTKGSCSKSLRKTILLSDVTICHQNYRLCVF